MQESPDKKLTTITTFQFQKGNKLECEDAPPVVSEQYAIVCDGLGGSGSHKHRCCSPNSDEETIHSSAFLGARIVSNYVSTFYQHANILELFSDNLSVRQCAVQNFVTSMKQGLLDELQQQYNHNYPLISKRFGDFHIFPTTLASVLYHHHQNCVKILSVWAGDSRVYILTPSKGLQQLTLDDSKSGKEMISDSAMSNCIKANHSFYINFSYYEINEPCVVFCCTDGCFDYCTPMHLEMIFYKVIEDNLPQNDNSIESQLFSKQLSEYICAEISDDTTMAGAIFGMSSYREMQALFLERAKKQWEIIQIIEPALNNLNKFELDESRAKRKIALLKERTDDSVIVECEEALKTGANKLLLKLFASLDCYKLFLNAIEKADQERKQNITIDCSALEQRKKTLYRQCQDAYLGDCIYSSYSNSNRSKKDRFLERLKTLFNQSPSDNQLPSDIHMYFTQCVESFSFLLHIPQAEEYLKNCSAKGIEGNNIDIDSCLYFIFLMQKLLNNQDPFFNSMLIQGFYMTPFFQKERNRILYTRCFRNRFKRIMNGLDNEKSLSLFTQSLIKEYNFIDAGFCQTKQKVLFKKKKMCVIETFVKDHRSELLDLVYGLNKKQIKIIFQKPETFTQIIDICEAYRMVQMAEKHIDTANAVIDEIWEKYRVDYRLFDVISDKGIVK